MSIATYIPELCSTTVTIQGTDLLDELLDDTGAGIVVLTVGTWPVLLRPEEARHLARQLTLAAEDAEADK